MPQRKTEIVDIEERIKEYGDQIERKTEKIVRLCLQNINGIQVGNMEEDFKDKLQTMMERQVDIIGWAETNLEWNSYKVNHELYKQLKDIIRIVHGNQR